VSFLGLIEVNPNEISGLMATVLECGGFDAAFPAFHRSEIGLHRWESGVKPAALHRLRQLRTIRLISQIDSAWA
jgi:hypothetical protein